MYNMIQSDGRLGHCFVELGYTYLRRSIASKCHAGLRLAGPQSLREADFIYFIAFTKVASRDGEYT